MHFRNPQQQRKPVGEADLGRVMEHLERKHGLVVRSIGRSSEGVLQVNFGTGKGQGNLQVYTAKFGRPTGNARLNIGEEVRMKSTRELLMQSAWFEDVVGHCVRPGRAGAEGIFQPEGVVVLPHVWEVTKPEKFEEMLRMVKKKLGRQGLKAMQQYLRQSGLNQGSESWKLMGKIFGEGEAVEGERAEKAKKVGGATKRGGQQR